MKTLTVNDVYKQLGRMIEQGKGEYDVFVNEDIGYSPMWFEPYVDDTRKEIIIGGGC